MNVWTAIAVDVQFEENEERMKECFFIFLFSEEFFLLFRFDSSWKTLSNLHPRLVHFSFFSSPLSLSLRNIITKASLAFLRQPMICQMHKSILVLVTSTKKKSYRDAILFSSFSFFLFSIDWRLCRCRRRRSRRRRCFSVTADTYEHSIINRGDACRKT